jgi:hypothetical protein
LSSPYAVYANKINPNIGTNESYNTRVIPYNTTQIGNIGSLKLPSANRCVANTYCDESETRIVTATAYGSEDNTWPDFRVDVSYNTIPSTLTFVPLKQASYQIEAKLRTMRQFGHINNIHSIDITKWDGYYILAVGYDLKYKDDDVNFGTLLLRIDASQATPTIEWFKNIKGAAFGAVMNTGGE